MLNYFSYCVYFCLSLTQCLSLCVLVDGQPSGRWTFHSAFSVLILISVEFYFPVVVLRTTGRSDWPPPPCVCDTLRTAHASFKDLCGAVASAHRLAGGSDCRPAAANHSLLHRWQKDVSANPVLLGTGGLGAVPEWDELQLRGGDVLRLAGEPQECSQGKEQWSPLLVWRGCRQQICEGWVH